jgi:hypothetical protein
MLLVLTKRDRVMVISTSRHLRLSLRTVSWCHLLVGTTQRKPKRTNDQSVEKENLKSY